MANCRRYCQGAMREIHPLGHKSIYDFGEPGYLQWEDQQGNPLAVNFEQWASDVVRGQMIYDASARVKREVVKKMYRNKVKAMGMEHIINL